MAISLSKISLTLERHQEVSSESLIYASSLPRKPNFLVPGQKQSTSRTLTKNKVLHKNESSSIVSEKDMRKNDHLAEVRIATETKRSLSECWKDIHGQNNWEGMLDPLDPLLRSELIRYGEMAQACYDAFDLDPYSKFCGSCKIDPDVMFNSLGHTRCGYDVTAYIYSTYNVKFPGLFRKSLRQDRWSKTANWIGYVAVSNDEYSAHLGRRDITIAWRGTVTHMEKIVDLMDFQCSTSTHKIPSRDQTIKVEAGFVNIYTEKDEDCVFSKNSAREQILAEVQRFTEKYSEEELSITVTGHSLGGALAILSAYDIAEIGLDVLPDQRTIPVCVYSFSGPRVGNARFKERLEMLEVKVLRVVNVHDVVPTLPGLFFNEHVPQFLQYFGGFSPWCYLHVGEELVLDHKRSPFLKDVPNLFWFHDLEVLLHLLDGLVGYFPPSHKSYQYRLLSQ